MPIDKQKYFEKNATIFVSSEKQAKELETCPICQCDYEEKDELTKLFCKHCYHTECIKKWLKDNSLCPMCKKDFRKHEEYGKFGLKYEINPLSFGDIVSSSRNILERDVFLNE